MAIGQNGEGMQQYVAHDKAATETTDREQKLAHVKSRGVVARSLTKQELDIAKAACNAGHRSKR